MRSATWPKPRTTIPICRSEARRVGTRPGHGERHTRLQGDWSSDVCSSDLGDVMPTKERTYSETEIAERLKELPGWYLEGGWIRRVYKTDGWPTTLMLVNAIGYLAEAAYHHPDL